MYRGMTIGTICWRSRIWTMTDDTKRTAPIMNGISMATYMGAQNDVSLGAKPVTRKMMARGTVAMSDVKAEPSTCDSGKHSRGKWLLAMRALFDTRALDPPPMDPPKRPKGIRPT